MEAERGMYVPLGGACSGDNVHLDRERRSRGTEPRASKGVSTLYKRVVESSRARGRKLPQRELKNTVPVVIFLFTDFSKQVPAPRNLRGARPRVMKF